MWIYIHLNCIKIIIYLDKSPSSSSGHIGAHASYTPIFSLVRKGIQHALHAFQSPDHCPTDMLPRDLAKPRSNLLVRVTRRDFPTRKLTFPIHLELVPCFRDRLCACHRHGSVHYANKLCARMRSKAERSIYNAHLRHAQQNVS